MTKNICASLDLNTSIKTFQSNATKLLDFANIPEWDGKKLKEREEEIRVQALILAGQCMAILLYNLSISPKILDYSVAQTQGWRSTKTQKHGYKKRQIVTIGNMEPKLLTIYVVNEQGKKIRTSAIPITNDGTYSGYKEFLKILEMYLVNLGISQAKQVLLIADGAEWIWIHIPPLLKKLKCPSETYQLLDLYHAVSHLKDFADAAFSTDNESQLWFKKARKALKKGQTLDLMRNMGEFISGATGERCKILVRERNYILKAYRRRLLKYNEVASQKLPLGSGAVESLIRQVVNLRMKGNSKFWLQNNAEIMLHLRCQWIAKTWDNFCDSIFNSLIKSPTG